MAKKEKPETPEEKPAKIPSGFITKNGATISTEQASQIADELYKKGLKKKPKNDHIHIIDPNR